MFGMFRRRDKQPQALNATTRTAPAAAYDSLEQFLRFSDRAVGLTSEERTVLLRLAANPPAWSNPLPATALQGPQPITAAPANTADVPLSATGPEQRTGGAAW